MLSWRSPSLWGLALLPLAALAVRLAYAATLPDEIVVTFEADPLTDAVVLIGEIGIVPEPVGEVLIPPEVRDELDRPRTPAPVRAWIASPPAWLRVRSAPPVPVEDIALASLDTGERTAIGCAG